MTPEARNAIIPHLTLCEALVLPDPFPSLSIEHYLTKHEGTLDISPPRVPTYCARTLHRLCELLSPVLALPGLPPLTGLHIPAPSLHSVTTISPLTSFMSSLTRLCITHGKTTYPELAAKKGPKAIYYRELNAILSHTSPATLRHLSITGLLKTSPCDPDITRRFTTLTALTHLRIPVPQNQADTFLHHFLSSLHTLSSLQDLTITHAYPSKLRYPGNLPPSLTRLHACGPSAGIAQIARFFTRSPLQEPPTHVRDVTLVCEPGRNPGAIKIEAADADWINRMVHGLIHSEGRCRLHVSPGGPEEISAESEVTSLGVIDSHFAVPGADEPPRQLETIWHAPPGKGFLDRALNTMHRLVEGPCMRALSMAVDRHFGPKAEPFEQAVHGMLAESRLDALSILRCIDAVRQSAIWCARDWIGLPVRLLAAFHYRF